MSRDMTAADVGRAAALVGAVAEGDAGDVAALLTSLTTDQLYAVAILLAANVDEDTTLRTMLNGEDPEVAVCRATVTAAAALWRVDPSEILSTERRRDVIDARHVAMAAARQCGLSLPTIGRFFGRDHTTVLSGVTRVGENRRLRTAAARIGWATLGGRPVEPEDIDRLAVAG